MTRGLRRRGSVIVMVTVALMLLLASVGLVVDLGWAYFKRRQAQVAADAAAQAGAQKAFELGELAKSFSSLGVNNSDVLDRARAYAQHNGFTNLGEGGRQTVTVTAGYPPMNDPNLNQLAIIYWVQARVVTRVSSMFITTSGAGQQLVSGAVAVAAVALAPVEGSVILLNQTCALGSNCVGPDLVQDDVGLGKGVNLDLGGNGTVTASGGVLLNSSANGDGRTNGKYALMSTSNAAQVITPRLQIARDGSYKGKPQDSSIVYTNGRQLTDPTLDMNFGLQPHVPVSTPSGSVIRNIVNATPGQVVYGVTANLGSSGQPLSLPPGVYVAGEYRVSGGVPIFSLANRPVRLDNVVFDNGGQPGNWVFLGGLHVGGPPGSQATATFAPGTYVVAGGPNGAALTIRNADVTDNGGGSYGELFLVTRPDYVADSSSPISSSNPILLDPTDIFQVQPWGFNGPLPGASAETAFAPAAAYPFGKMELKSGQGNGTISLTGLKGPMPCTPGACSPSNGEESYLYRPAVIWQDRRNAFNAAATMESNAAAIEGLNGLIYMPRGSLITMTGGGAKTGLAKVIAGAIQLQGKADVTLNPNPIRSLKTVVALVR